MGSAFNRAGVTGSSDLSQFPISTVQRIEYLRGPRSAVYGSDAIGGVVNIITTRAKDGTTLNAGVGTHGFQNYGGSTQQTLGESTRVTLAGITPTQKALTSLLTVITAALPRPIATAL